MNIAIFSAKKYDREFLNAANGSLHELRFFEPQLNEETVGLATGLEAVCVFVNDQVNASVMAKLRALGVRLIALRCAGYNNVDLSAATKNGITVVRVPAYSPYAVAEHTIALMLALNKVSDHLALGGAAPLGEFCRRDGDAMAGKGAQHGLRHFAMVGNQGAAHIQRHQLDGHGPIIAGLCRGAAAQRRQGGKG